LKIRTLKKRIKSHQHVSSIHQCLHICLVGECYTPGNDSEVRGALAVVGLTWLVETGYWALRAELIIYLCWLAVNRIGWDVAAKYVTMRDLKFVGRSRETCFTRYMTIKEWYVETAFHLNINLYTNYYSHIELYRPSTSERKPRCLELFVRRNQSFCIHFCFQKQSCILQFIIILIGF